MASTIKDINKVNQLISENIEDLIFICNENIECEYYNIKEIQYKKHFIDFLHPNDSERIIEFVKNVFKFGIEKEEFRIIGDNNLFKWYEIKGKKFVATDNTKKVFLICRDITRLKNMENEIKKSQSRYTQLADTLPEIKYWKLLQSKKSITAVQKTREMLEVVINNIPQLIYWKDTKLVYLGCNTSFASINGLVNPHSIIGRTDDDLKWATDKLEYIQECEYNVIKNNKPEYKSTELLMTPDGKQTWYEINRIPLHDMGGKVVGILVTYEDISIRKFSEQKLKESEEKYRGILENIKESYFEVDLNGTFTFLSEAFSNLTGIPKEELLGMSYKNLLDEENKKKNREVYREVFETEQSKSDFQFQFQNENGEYLTCESSVYLRYDSDGKKIGFSGVARDITEKYSLERKLKESEEKYRTIFNSSPDYIFITDVEGIILDMNLALLKRIGMTLDKVRGINFAQFYAGDNLDELLLIRDEIKSGKEIIGSEVKARAKTGEIFEYEVNSVPIKENGKVVKVINLARDVTEKKIAEQKLKESELKYRHLFENSPYSIILINKKGLIIDCNPATEKVFDNKIEELINRNFLDVVIKSDKNLPLYGQRYQSLLEGIIPDPIEIQIPRSSDGRLIWVGITESLVDIGGETVFQIIIQDITEKKIAEQKLKKSQEDLQILNKELEQKVKERTKNFIESERQYRTTIDSLGDPLHVVDNELRIILINLALKKWLDELNLNVGIYGRKISEAFPFLPPKIYEEYQQVFDTGTPLITLENTLLPELEVITETRKIPIFHEGKVEQIITIIRDVTENKNMETQLKESEEKFRNMVNNLDVGFYKGMYKGKLLMHNQAFNRILGLEPHESAVGMDSTQFFVDEKRQQKYYKELEEKGFVRNFIAQVKKVNGDIITVDLNAHVIYDSEGEIAEAEGTFSDITEKFDLQQELLESEKKLREQNIELMKLDEVKNDFITMAAHELKTPLISISGYTDYILMKHRNSLAPEITEDLKTVQRNVTRLEVLMDQLLDVMKIDENKLEIQKEQVNITKIINDCLDELSYLINEKNLEVILNIDHEIILNVDPNRIFTVFTNLISNSIKFTQDYGWIEISGKNVEDKYIFEVKDNGIGLTEEELSRLFIKFERINQDSGTGLGLFITKGIVNAHNGEIRASSDGLDKGTTFEFTLPR